MIGVSAASSLVIFLSFILFLFSKASKRVSIIIVASFIYLFFMNSEWALAFILLSFSNYFAIKKYKRSYANKFFLTSLNLAVWVFLKIMIGHQLTALTIILPLGFSIFIFQQLSFILNEETELPGGLSEYLVYSLFFANIATGPLWDFSEFKKQFKSNIYLRSSDLYLGGIIFLIGFAKKVILADNLTPITRFLFSAKEYSGNLLFPFLLNKYEIYLNFLSFSEMAIGLALIFGFKLRDNFNKPFATTSIAEFWKRWHITLVDWIRYYVFYPLLVSRLSFLGVHFLMLIVFVLFGLWHGFSVNHLLYGAIQFALVFLDSRYGKFFHIRSKGLSLLVLTFLKWIFFYVFLISIPGIIFRTSGLSMVRDIMENLVTRDLRSAFDIFEYVRAGMIGVFSCVVLNEVFEYFVEKKKISSHIQMSPIWLKAIYFIVYLLIIFYFGNWSDIGSFTYSRF